MHSTKFAIMQSRRKAVKQRRDLASCAATCATAFLFLWAAYGLAQQSDDVMRRCPAAGASKAECQLRIYGR